MPTPEDMQVDRDPDFSGWSDTEEFDAAQQAAEDARQEAVLATGREWTPEIAKDEIRSVKRTFVHDFCEQRKNDGHSRKHFICESVHDDGSRCPYNQEYGPSTVNSRAIVSDFFGRNKRNFQQIPKKHIVLVCRKCYQIRRYNSKGSAYAYIKLDHILKMLDKLEAWAPGVKYHVQLQAPLQKKYNHYLTELRYNQLDLQKLGHALSDTQTAAFIEAEYTSTKPTDDVRDTKLELIDDISRRFCSKVGHDKTKSDVEDFVATIRSLLAQGKCTVVPPLEFLPEIQRESKRSKKGKLRTNRRQPARIRKGKALDLEDDRQDDLDSHQSGDDLETAGGGSSVSPRKDQTLPTDTSTDPSRMLSPTLNLKLPCGPIYMAGMADSETMLVHPLSAKRTIDTALDDTDDQIAPRPKKVLVQSLLNGSPEERGGDE